MPFSRIDTRLRLVVSLAGILAAGACGGGDGGTTPSTVARVELTGAGNALEVGKTLQLTVRYFDASSVQLDGKTPSYSTSNSSIATVSTSGLVTAVEPGSVTITATVDGVNGTFALTVTAIPVFFIQISPASPIVRETETVTLSAQPTGPQGQVLTRQVAWTSASAAIATVNQQGIVTGVSPGYVYIRATADTRTDSVSIRVRSLLTPAISGTSAGQLVPDGSGTINGTNFGATVADNLVLVNGVAATITAATTSAITFTVPSKASLPCSATGSVPVSVVARNDTVSTTMNLRVATEVDLAVGESRLLINAPDLVCNEFVGSGQRKYIVTAWNYAPSAAVRTSFRLTGSGTGSAAMAGVATGSAFQPGPPLAVRPDRTIKHRRAHAAFMETEQTLSRELGSPRRSSRPGTRDAAPAAVAPPNVGDRFTYRMRRTINSAQTFDNITFKVVYVGPKMIILEDIASPLAGTMDAEFVRIGEEYDQVMHDQLLTFGDPLISDPELDNNGRLLALFTPKVNGYTVNGVTNSILGFVTICDFFTRAQCASSNEGEAFYALVPDPAAGWTLSFWRRLIRGTLIHEAKHITSYAYRFFNDATFLEDIWLEDIWLEEATAQQASEIWARSVYGRSAKEDLGWLDGPDCDYAPAGGACPDPAEGILHHFGYLYDHYAAAGSKSILDNSDTIIYGSTWSFMRYVTDQFAPTEAGYLGSLVQVKDDRGVANVEKIGRPFSELLGRFSLASAVDNYPGVTLADPLLQLPSWNSRDLFQGMNVNLVTSNDTPAYPLSWPLATRQVSFGNFAAAASDVTELRGGGFLVWELSGVQGGPQALSIRSSTGGAAPAQVGMAIVRLQ